MSACTNKGPGFGQVVEGGASIPAINYGEDKEKQMTVNLCTGLVSGGGSKILV